MTPEQREKRKLYFRAYRARQTPETRRRWAQYPARERAAAVTAKRRDFLNRWKLAAGCIDCGYTAHPVALDFDHLDPTGKVAGVGEMTNKSWTRLIAEIAKCVVRCSNCHRIKTFGGKTT